MRGTVYRGLSKISKKSSPTNQLSQIPSRCHQQRRIHFANTKVIVIDDKKILHLPIQKRKWFYADNFAEYRNNVKYKEKVKFVDKVLV